MAKLKGLVNGGLNTFGYEVKRQHGLERAAWLKEMGIKTVLDVGANVGQFSTLIRKLLPGAEIYAFEPIVACYQELSHRRRADSLFHTFPYALGAEDGTAALNVNDFTPSSSLLPMASSHVKEFPFTAKSTGATVEVRRLDTVAASLDLAEPMLVKLDVQGFEMQVIEGGCETLAKADVLITEISFADFYEGQPSFEELHTEIQSLGLCFHGMLGQTHSTHNNRPLFCDALFIRAGKL
jgi:FkbM family methyltransferase